MPLDRSFDFDPFWKRCLGWQLKFSFYPRRCFISSRRLWFKQAYRGIAVWTGPGDPVFEHRWLSKEEFLMNKIRGTI